MSDEITQAVGAPLQRQVRPLVADVMRLGDTPEFEVWFLPTDREGYGPRVLIDGLAAIEAAHDFVEQHASTYYGALEIVRTTARRQRVA